MRRIQSVPLVIGQFLEMVDNSNGIVGSTTGAQFSRLILQESICCIIRHSGGQNVIRIHTFITSAVAKCHNVRIPIGFNSLSHDGSDYRRIMQYQCYMSLSSLAADMYHRCVWSKAAN